MKTSDIIALGGLGIGAFVLFTDQGKDMFEDLTGIQVPDVLGMFDDVFDPDEGGVERLVEESRERKSGKFPKEYYGDDIYYPPQHLFLPPNYYKFKHEIDTNRIPSEEFWDWYRKGSGMVWKDYYYPPHYTWNPDYYFYFGNMYKKWYPSAMEPNRYPGDRGWEPIAQTARDFPFYPY